MAGERVLVIEDSAGVRKLLHATLPAEGLTCVFACSGEEGLEATRDHLPDLIVLDLNLPGMDGLDVCRQLKADPRTAAVPIVMLTGRGEETDVVRGLEMGADDYLSKPFSPKILAARLRAVLRRRADDTGPALLQTFHALTLDEGLGEARLGDIRISLRPPEARFLRLLLATTGGGGEQPSQITDPPGEDSIRQLEEEGLTLYVLNRLDQITRLFADFPEELLAGHPWLALFTAMAGRPVDQAVQQRLLAAAREGFAAAGERTGELLAGAQLLHFAVLFEPGDQDPAPLAARVETLAREWLEGLSPYAQIHVTQCLALASALAVEPWLGKTDYIERARELADRHGVPRLAGLTQACRGYRLLRQGKLDQLVRLLENANPDRQDAAASPLPTALLHLLQLWVLLLRGDEFNRRRLERRLAARVEESFGRRSFLRQELALLRLAGVLLGTPDRSLLDECRRRAMDSPAPWRQQQQALQALAAARMGTEQEAQLAAQKALQMLGECREPFARGWTALVIAASGLLQAETRTVHLALGPGRAAAGALGNRGLSAALQGQELAAGLLSGGHHEVDLAPWLRELQEVGPVGLLGCPDPVRRRLWQAVVARNLQGCPGAGVLAESLVLAAAAAVPYLQMRTLGGCEFFLEGRRVLQAEALTPAQRELFALLVAAPGMKLSQDEIQLAFWPDSSPEKARSSFDSLLLRMRKVLEKALDPAPVRDYLLLQKGILALTQVRVDAHEFAALVDRGLELARKHNFWQAENALAQALELWQGEFMPGASVRDQTAALQEELDRRFVNGVLTLASHLIAGGRIEEAFPYLRRAQRLDPTNDDLARAQCRAHLRNGQIVKAHQVMRRYADELRRENYSGAEIDEILATFPTTLPPGNEDR